MKLILLTFFILFLASCGIDKESPPPLSSVTDNSGELDISFHSKGYYTLNGSAGGNGDDQIYDMAVDSQNRIIAVGSSANGGGDLDMTVWRLDSAGDLDSSFGISGVFAHDSAAGGASTDVAYGVTVDSSDNIYVTGTSYNGSNYDMVVWKLTSSGSLDTSFNGTGFFVHDNAAGGSQHDQGTAIYRDSGGKLYVTGFSDQTATNRDMAMWKLTSAGALDTGFNGTGIFTHDAAAGGEDENGNDIGMDSLGRLIVVGRADSVSNLGDMAIWRVSSSGALDTTFNGTGYFTQNNAAGGSGFDSATALTFDAVGSLYVTGYSKNMAGNNDMILWKILDSGALDTSFNSNGYIVFDVSNLVGGATNDTGEDIMIDSNGKIVVVGSGHENMYIWRFNSDATLDTSFNTDGIFAHDSAAGGFSTDSGTCVVEDSSNHIYIGGFSKNSSLNFDATFWRMQ